jgi:hypothetical protein
MHQGPVFFDSICLILLDIAVVDYGRRSAVGRQRSDQQSEATNNERT